MSGATAHRVPTMRRPLLILLALSLCALPCRAAQTASQTPSADDALDPAAFSRELETLSGRIRALGGEPQSAAALRESLPRRWRVRVESETWDVSPAWLEDALTEHEKRPTQREAIRKRILARLAEMRAQAEALAQPPETQIDAQARTKLEEILAQREFQSLRSPGFWDELKERIAGAIGDFLEWLFGRAGRFPAAGEILVWITIALAFILLALWVTRHLRNLSREPELEIEGALPPPMDWLERIRMARAAAARGDHRAAILHAYWAGVLRLEQTGVWKSDLARTPREYLRMLGPGHAMQQPLVTLTQRFERTWYGYAPATAADFEETLGLLKRLGCQFT